VLVALSLLMTLGVYGLVAGIVKLDDLGALLIRRSVAAGGQGRAAQGALGTAIVRAAPWLMKALSVAGTIAMFLVGGGILSHGLPFAHHLLEHIVQAARGTPGIGAALAALLPALFDLMVGVIAGSLILAVVMLVQRLQKARQRA
jgi:uncharacterized protein